LNSLELGAGRGRRRQDADGDDVGPGGDACRPQGKSVHHHRHYSLGDSSQVEKANASYMLCLPAIQVDVVYLVIKLGQMTHNQEVVGTNPDTVGILDRKAKWAQQNTKIKRQYC
jgi:hypothetical protein